MNINTNELTNNADFSSYNYLSQSLCDEDLLNIDISFLKEEEIGEGLIKTFEDAVVKKVVPNEFPSREKSLWEDKLEVKN